MINQLRDRFGTARNNLCANNISARDKGTPCHAQVGDIQVFYSVKADDKEAILLSHLSVSIVARFLLFSVIISRLKTVIFGSVIII